MPSPGTSTTHAFNLADIPAVVRGAKGVRAVVDFAPKPTSPERMVAGVVTRLDTGEVSFTCAIDPRKVEHAFGDSGTALHAIALKLCQSLADHWKTNPHSAEWRAPFSGARLAELSRFSGRNAAEAQHLMLNRSSAMHTLLQAYELAQLPRVTGIVERVKTAVRQDRNSQHLAQRFNRALPLGDDALPLKVDFLGRHFACYFLQISANARSIEINTERAYGKLYELQALSRFIKKPRKILGLLEDERPEVFELVMVGDRNNLVQRRAIYQVEALADKGKVVARAVPTVHAAAEHLAEKERLAA